MALLGERFIGNSAENETPEQQQIRAEIQKKLTRLHELMTKTRLFPVKRGNIRGSNLGNSLDFISGVAQYQIGTTPETTKVLKVWLEAKDYAATTEVEPSPETDFLEAETTRIYTMVALMTQAVVNDKKTGETHLLGMKKVRARARPVEDETSMALEIEGLTDREFALYDLDQQLSMVDGALQTVELIASASPPHTRQAIGTLAASLTVF
jgi:hypothetical protein